MTIQPLCDKSLAALHVRYIVPLAVSGILRGEDVMDDIAEYTIQDLMSEFEPDEALMALALCAQHIAAHTGDHVMGRALKIEADKIVEEYGPVMMAHDADQLTYDDPRIVDLLMNVPEDLECLSDIMLALSGTIVDETRAIVAILCDILGEQADIFREYSEYKLDELDIAEMAASSPQKDPMIGIAHSHSQSGVSNVIPFPVNKRRAG